MIVVFSLVNIGDIYILYIYKYHTHTQIDVWKRGLEFQLTKCI